MNRDELLARIRACEAAIRAEGATHVALFGSRARGDNRPDNDVDILFNYDPSVKIPSWMGAGIYGIIKDATGLEVSLASRRGCDPVFARRISSDLIEVF